MHLRNFLLAGLLTVYGSCAPVEAEGEHDLIERQSAGQNLNHRILYVPTLSWVGAQTCCTFGLYCLIQNQPITYSDGTTDQITAEFYATPYYASPIAAITSKKNSNDFAVIAGQGTCDTPPIYTAPAGSPF